MDFEKKNREQLINELLKAYKKIDRLKIYNNLIDKKIYSDIEKDQFCTFLRTTTKVAVISINIKGEILNWNDESEELFYYSNIEVIGKNISFLFLKEYKNKFQNIFNQMLITEKLDFIGKTVKILAVKKGGLTFPIEFSIASCQYKNEDIFIVIIRNISLDVQFEKELLIDHKQLEKLVNERTIELQSEINERVKVEDILRESEEKLRRVIENMPVMMNAFDKNGYIIVWNKECERVTDFSATEMLGSPWASQLLYPDEGYRKYIVEKLKISGSDFRDIELDIESKKGEKKTILWSNMSEEFPIPGWYSWGIGLDITKRVLAEKQIKKSLKEKEVLLQEIHHRVKNNLAIISSLLELQSSTIQDKQTRSALLESKNRINVMARIHEHLYSSQDLVSIDMKYYIQGIVDYLSQSFGEYSISILINVPDVNLNIDRAIPCGLIINELVSNALKHAFHSNLLREKEKQISVSLKLIGNDCKLIVSDNGIGLSENIEIEKNESMGLKLVKILVTQLRGSFDIKRKNGTSISLLFSIED